jgi:hypothetical protein
MPRGGARANAGRPKLPERPPKEPSIQQKEIKTKVVYEAKEDEPESVAFMRAVMNNDDLDIRIRTDAARQLLPYQARRLGETGKKEEREKKAKQAESKFAKAQPPKLVSNKK